MENLLVLVVDDEESVNLILREALEEAGYAVVAAWTASEALQRLDEYRDAVRGLVTDVRWRGEPTGWDVARRAREIAADMAVVYVTGGAGHEWAAQGVPGSVLIPKPFVPSQVVTAISNLLTITRPQQLPG
jgi:CheY-like chemotaxis protein